MEAYLSANELKTKAIKEPRVRVVSLLDQGDTHFCRSLQSMQGKPVKTGQTFTIPNHPVATQLSLSDCLSVRPRPSVRSFLLQAYLLRFQSTRRGMRGRRRERRREPPTQTERGRYQRESEQASSSLLFSSLLLLFLRGLQRADDSLSLH